MTTGVYLIRNTKNGKVYVGSSIGIENRFKAHKYGLERNKHHSRKLQNSWNKHGAKAFELVTALICGVENLLMHEQQIIEFYDAYRSGYNGVPNARSRAGSKHHKDVVDRMKEFQRSGRRNYEWKGDRLCLTEIAEKEGVSFRLLEWRVRHGWDLAEAISTPQGRHRTHHTAYGKTRTLAEWADVLSVPVANLVMWERNGGNFEYAVEKAKRWTPHELGRSVGEVKPRTFLERINRGWSAGDALLKPPNGTHVIKRSRIQT